MDETGLIEIHADENRTVIDLIGELIIDDAAQLKTVFLQAVKRGKTIELNLAQLTKWDLSILQLFCSLSLTLKSHPMKLIFTNYSSEIKEVIKKSGFVSGQASLIDCFSN